MKLAALAKRVKRRMASKKSRLQERKFFTANTEFDPVQVVPDPKILANFKERVVRFGDIFNGYKEAELCELLK